jgi:hypothetical protein
LAWSLSLLIHLSPAAVLVVGGSPRDLGARMSNVLRVWRLGDDGFEVAVLVE